MRRKRQWSSYSRELSGAQVDRQKHVSSCHRCDSWTAVIAAKEAMLLTLRVHEWEIMKFRIGPGTFLLNPFSMDLRMGTGDERTSQGLRKEGGCCMPITLMLLGAWSRVEVQNAGTAAHRNVS